MRALQLKTAMAKYSAMVKPLKRGFPRPGSSHYHHQTSRAFTDHSPLWLLYRRVLSADVVFFKPKLMLYISIIALMVLICANLGLGKRTPLRLLCK